MRKAAHRSTALQRARPSPRLRRMAAVAVVAVVSVSTALPSEPLLETDVLPILRKRCMGCHGGLEQKAGLDLRTLRAMLRGGDEGPALVAGRPDESELWVRIAEDEMPRGKEKLTAEEKEAIRRWIEAGLPTFAERMAGEDDPLLPAGKEHEPREVAAAIDRHIEAGLAAAGLEPATLSGDAEFLRRAYLDLTGRIPAPEAASAFLDSKDPEKRAKLIDTLLSRPEFGEQLGRAWRDWIAPPELPSDMNGGRQPIKETRKLGVWFAERFNAGEPWDRIVRSVLSGEGDVQKSPQLIFFGLAGQNAKVTPYGSARSVASLFLGVGLECAQCHDDPYRDWSQDEFWSQAAFFGNVKGNFKKVEENAGEGRVTIPDSAFKNAGAEVTVAFLDAREMEAEGKVAWRSVFADWLTSPENPWFARAFANRLWFYLFARGIVNPVDDLRELNPPSHPGLLRLLENEFVASKFDVKHLIRCVCNSKAYQRASRSEPDPKEADRAAQAELFGRARVRVMTADMLLDSLELAYGEPELDLRTIEKKDGNSSGESAPVGDPYLEFHRAFGTNEEDATDFTHGIPQMLTLINHPRLLAGSRALDAFREAEPAPSMEQTIERLYLATLSRRPTSEELAEVSAYVTGAAAPDAAYNDVLWMLVNRSEFICIR